MLLPNFTALGQLPGIEGRQERSLRLGLSRALGQARSEGDTYRDDL